MSAATILEQQAHAHLRNAIHGYSARQQLSLAEARIRELHDRLVADEHAALIYGAVVTRPMLLQVAASKGAVQVDFRDALDGADETTIRWYLNAAVGRAADALADAEHCQRLLTERGTRP